LIYVIPEIDATYITPRMKESGLRMEVQCHDEPKSVGFRRNQRMNEWQFTNQFFDEGKLHFSNGGDVKD
jgi:hypothetical protein